MSTRGRKPELQIVEGVVSVQPFETVPAHIPADMHVEWRAVVEDLKMRKMLTDAMFGTVDTYVMGLWNMRKAQQALDDHGPLIVGDKGVLKQNPANTMLGKAQNVVLRLSAELGLTPASRSREKMKGRNNPRRPDEGDLFDVLMDI